MRSVPGNEARVLLLARDKLKLRKKKSTEWKHDYSRGLGIHLSPYDELGFTLQLDAAGAHSVELAAEILTVFPSTRVTFVDMAPTILPGFDPPSVAHAMEWLKTRGCALRLAAAVGPREPLAAGPC